jgi:putative heme iron utilization protein
MEQTEQPESLGGARRLWTGRFQGVLSTQSAAKPGYPFGSVVPYCLDADALPIFLLSHLAQHSRNLDADPRCALTLAEPAAGDVQQSERLTCIGDCAQLPPEDLPAASRYFRYFPNARTYYKKLNFHLYRLVPLTFHYNGGFATARWLGTERILRPSPLVGERERALINWIERHHGEVLRAHFPAGPQGRTPLRVVGVDPRGIDLRLDDRLKRLHFPTVLTSAEAIADYLARLT